MVAEAEEVAEAGQDKFLKNMDATEGEGGAATDISPVVAEYDKWKEHGKKFAIGQALHPAVLNNIPWERDVTPMEIAGFILGVAKEESLHWVDDRKWHYWLE